jgi:hypothetical protein
VTAKREKKSTGPAASISGAQADGNIDVNGSGENGLGADVPKSVVHRGGRGQTNTTLHVAPENVLSDDQSTAEVSGVDPSMCHHHYAGASTSCKIEEYERTQALNSRSFSVQCHLDIVILMHICV